MLFKKGARSTRSASATKRQLWESSRPYLARAGTARKGFSDGVGGTGVRSNTKVTSLKGIQRVESTDNWVRQGESRWRDLPGGQARD